ncbi:MAG: hypothetical protein IAE65_11680 [Ignavibacteria bacterium]|nr:hypothetical protein [Ignavibacteria bacterium]
MYKFLIIIFSLLVFYSCSSAPDIVREREEKENKEDYKKPEVKSTAKGDLIFDTAFEEQKNRMYSKSEDSIYLYWLNNQLLILGYQSRCNIFAINTLHKAGFKCPDVNTLTYDLMDTTRFLDILPVIRFNDLSEIEKGDLIVWNGHVIIFEKLVKTKTKIFAQAIWAGTRQNDNGENIMNNVIYGKYPLEGYFIIRRPQYK